MLLPALVKQGVIFPRREDWTEAQRAWIRDYFMRELLPVLTPIGLDPAHPFPRVLNKSLNLAIELEGRDSFGRKSRDAIVQAPRALPRVIRLPADVAGAEYAFVFLSSVLHAHVDELFSGMEVKGCHQFRVTRNSDLFVDEEEIKNMRIAIQGELLQRHFGDAVRLEVADSCSQQTVDFLLQQFGLSESDLYRVDGPVNLYRLREVIDRVDRPDLKYPAFQPAPPQALTGQRDIYAVLKKQDVLLHHPYESFTPVIDFIRTSVTDPRVIAIKQTVYRTGTDSELMDILIEAARKGKEVTVVVELMARFDEEANINWAARLEEAGAHVVYGVVGHKTHAKMALVVRREDGPQGSVLRRYAHLATGNYHPRTARQYTDFGLLTAREEICSDVNEVFKQLTGLGRSSRMKHLWLSPFTLHKRVVAAVRNEARLAKEGKPARIMAKMNALLEPELIEELYAASQRRRADRPDRARRLRAAAGRRRPVGEHPRALRGRALPRAHAHLLLPERRRRGRLPVQRRLDGPQFLPPHRARVSRCSTRRSRQRVINEGLQAYLDDASQAWAMTLGRRLRGAGAAPRQAARGAGRIAARAGSRDLIGRAGAPR